MLSAGLTLEAKCGFRNCLAYHPVSLSKVQSYGPFLAHLMRMLTCHCLSFGVVTMFQENGSEVRHTERLRP